MSDWRFSRLFFFKLFSAGNRSHKNATIVVRIRTEKAVHVDNFAIHITQTYTFAKLTSRRSTQAIFWCATALVHEIKITKTCFKMDVAISLLWRFIMIVINNPIYVTIDEQYFIGLCMAISRTFSKNWNLIPILPLLQIPLDEFSIILIILY